MTKRFSLLFYLKKGHSVKSNACIIYLRITYDQKRAEISTKRFCDPARWNSAAGKMSGSKDDAKTLNAYLDTLQSKVYEIHRRLIEADETISAEAIKNKFLGITDRPRYLMETFREHNLQMKKLIVAEEYASGTLTHFETTYSHVSDFLRWKFSIADIDIKKINYEFISDLEFYLKAEKKLGHNTTMKYLGDFKKIVLLCVKRDWLFKDPFMDYPLARKEVVKDFLVQEELDIITNKEFKAPRLALVRDIFLFSCYTGLAYSDVKKLQHSEIQTGIDGFKWLFIQRQKSGSPAAIPLLPACLSILERYQSHPKCIQSQLVLPILSNQKMNGYLKEMADVCGIHKNLTYHLARHTFATTVTLNNNVPIESVSKMLGHKSLKQTQHYAKVLNKKVGEDMQVLREKLAAKDNSSNLKAIS
jgi:site-specific recombinase XerD